MKECPNCKELLGDNVSVCFNCGWNFDDPSENERAAERERARKEQQEIERKRQKELQKEMEIERRRIWEENRQNELRRLEEKKKRIQELNDQFEYLVITVPDNSDGSPNTHKITEELNRYAADNWHLHSVFTNEIGKNSTTVGIGGASSGLNATIETTVIIFERLVDSKKF